MNHRYPWLIYKNDIVYSSIHVAEYSSIIYISIVYCKCGNCVLGLEVKPDETRGCLETEPCKEKMLEENMHDQHLILVVLTTLWKYQDFGIPPLH
jgi:hypothetical protein